MRSFSSDASAEKVEARRYFTDHWIRPAELPGAAPGHHRFVWDLRAERPKAAEYEYTMAAVDDEDTPTVPRGPLMPPGRYTVRLAADGKKVEQTLQVKQDPRTSVAPDVFAERLALEKRIVAAMDSSFEALEQVRAARKGAASPKEQDLAQLEADLTRVNRNLGTLLNQIDASDSPATAVQSASLKENLEALDAGRSRWRQVSSGG